MAHVGFVGMSSIVDLVSLVSRPALILDEKLMQHGRDGIFLSVRILSGPPMADAVIAATIFHPHWRRTRPELCQGAAHRLGHHQVAIVGAWPRASRYGRGHQAMTDDIGPEWLNDLRESIHHPAHRRNVANG